MVIGTGATPLCSKVFDDLTRNVKHAASLCFCPSGIAIDRIAP
jgi:hypothetical protein